MTFLTRLFAPRCVDCGSRIAGDKTALPNKQWLCSTCKTKREGAQQRREEEQRRKDLEETRREEEKKRMDEETRQREAAINLPLGTVDILPELADALRRAGEDVQRFVQLHKMGTWSNLTDSDAFNFAKKAFGVSHASFSGLSELNRAAMKNAGPVSSIFRVTNEMFLLIITTPDRSKTMLALTDASGKALDLSRQEQGTSKPGERAIDQVQGVSSAQFVEFRDRLLAELNDFRSANDEYATGRAVQRVGTLLRGFPDTRAKEPMTKQIVDDFRTNPLWEAAVMTIKSYVPWTDPTATQDQRDQMSRILLTVAAQSLDWLAHDPTGNVQHEVR